MVLQSWLLGNVGEMQLGARTPQWDTASDPRCGQALSNPEAWKCWIARACLLIWPLLSADGCVKSQAPMEQE